MKQAADLAVHPANHCKAVRRIAVAIERMAAEIQFSYRLEGDIPALRLPEPAEPLRADSLWQHSCFEAFLRPDDSDGYYEFNFAPSTAWAAYRFAARRESPDYPELAAPVVICRRDADSFDMTVRLSLEGLPELAGVTAIDAGLTAVVEDARGLLSYWALAHTAREPDFHDPAAFLMRIRAR
jgi:hypothetical protein